MTYTVFFLINMIIYYKNVRILLLIDININEDTQNPVTQRNVQ